MYVVEMIDRNTGEIHCVIGVYSDNRHAQYAAAVHDHSSWAQLSPRVSYFETDYIDPVKEDALLDWDFE